MPKIQLKPNSAEFAEETKAPKTHKCDINGCHLEALYKAPKNKNLKDYYWFCLDHVQAYNRAWNYFEGMDADEMQTHIYNSFFGDRPTWKFDKDSNFEDNLRHKAWQTYHHSDKDKTSESSEQSDGGNRYINTNTPEYESMMIMGLTPPLSLNKIKAKYKELAKQYHPDLNKNDKEAEELLKSINMAYTILKLAYENYEKLIDKENP